MTDGASSPQEEPGLLPVGFRTRSPEVGGAGFDPRSGASCGPVTGAPIRKRVIAARFLDAALSQAVVPRGTCAGVVHTFSGATHHPGFPRTADMGGMRPDSRARQPSGVGGTRDTTFVTASGKRLGSGLGVDGGCVPIVGFTPALKGGILSSKKIVRLLCSTFRLARVRPGSYD